MPDFTVTPGFDETTQTMSVKVEWSASGMTPDEAGNVLAASYEVAKFGLTIQGNTVKSNTSGLEELEVRVAALESAS